MLDWIRVVLWYRLLYFSFKPSSTADKSNIFAKTLFLVHGEWRCCWSQCQRAVVIIVVMTTCCEVQDTTAGFLCSCEDVLLLSAIIGPVLTHMHCGAWQAGSPLTPDAAQIHAGWGYRSTGLNMQQVCPPKEIGSVSGYILGKSKRSSGMVLDYPC